MLMHINGNCREGGDALMNMPIHTSSLFWRGEGSKPTQLPGFVRGAGDWRRPGFSFYLQRQGLSTCLCCPASALSPDSPSCCSFTNGCVRKSEKTISPAPTPAQLPHQPSSRPVHWHPQCPVLQVMALLGKAAGGVAEGVHYSVQG